MEDTQARMSVEDAKSHQPALHENSHAHTQVHGRRWSAGSTKKLR